MWRAEINVLVLAEKLVKDAQREFSKNFLGFRLAMAYAWQMGKTAAANNERTTEGHDGYRVCEAGRCNEISARV